MSMTSSNWDHPGNVYPVKDDFDHLAYAFDCERVRHIMRMALHDEAPGGYYSDADCALWGAIRDELRSYFKEKEEYYSDVFALKIERYDDSMEYWTTKKADCWIPENIYTKDPRDTLADLAGDIIDGTVRYIDAIPVCREEAMDNYRGPQSFVW